MGQQIIGLHQWFETPPGQYLLGWQRARVDAAVSDLFGYHALQLGLPELDALKTNRMPHQWLGDQPGAPQGLRAPDFLTDFDALPFPAASLDLVVLPHALEISVDPHATLREVERVLVPEGRVVIAGLNPASLWGLRQRRAHLYRRMGMGELFLPSEGEFIGYWRLRDWLRLLGFEVESSDFGCWRPAVGSQAWLQRFEWMDRLGARWWPIFGAVYFVVAVKRVRGMRLLAPGWKRAGAPGAAPAPVSVAGQVQPMRPGRRFDEEKH
ncbi:MAG: methyltransferase domain-containing protein [Ramlibacter sp.]|jgi:SAM-dependent methyltransferase|nr:methyltransferase domain-containing protein [Ramlibacter sp.]